MFGVYKILQTKGKMININQKIAMNINVAFVFRFTVIAFDRGRSFSFMSSYTNHALYTKKITPISI